MIPKLDNDQLESFIRQHQHKMTEPIPPQLWEKLTAKFDESAIEDFIKQKKEAFDQDQPSKIVWNQLSEQLDQQKSQPTAIFTSKYRRGWQTVAVAASFFLLGLLMQQLLSTNSTNQPNPIAEQASDTALFSFEQQYQQQIKQQIRQVKAFGEIHDRELKDDFEDQMKTLELEYQLLKDEISEGKPINRITDAMINNLKAQTELLNLQINILKQIQSKTKKDETIDL